MTDTRWLDILDALRRASALLTQTWAPDDPQIAAELHRQLMMNISLGYFVYFQSDANYPDFAPFLNSVYLLQPNPDDTYFLAPIDGCGTYRVSGDRGGVHLLTLTLTDRMMGVDEQLSPLLAEFDVGDLVAPGEALDLVLSATAPVGDPGHWLPLDPRARFLMIRQRSYAWGKEADARLAITRLDPVPPQTRMAAHEVETRIDALTGFAERLSRFWLGHQTRLRETLPVNIVRFAPFAAQGGVKVQAYWEAMFEFGADEALILESDLPIRRPYWNVQLNDPLFNTLDYVWHQSSDCVEKVGLRFDLECPLIAESIPSVSGGCHLQVDRDELGHLAEVLSGCCQ